MTRPTCRPGTAWSGYWAGPTSSTSRTPSCAPGPRWATSTAVVAGSSPSCPGPALRTARSASTCKTHTPVWTEAARRSGARQGDPDQVYSTTPAPLPSLEGYRIGWVHSTAKARRDAHARAAGINSGVTALEALDAKLAGPRCRFKTRVAVEQAATIALTDTGADRWVTATVTQTTTKTYKQARAGRPGPKTSYREVSTTRFTVTHDIKLDQIRSDAASDGCFPLISNDRLLSDAQVLAAYRYQPNLERRHHLLKSVQDAAPVLLHNPARIEALFCCQFLALLIAALIEREVRTGMQRADLAKIRLYPEFRNCTAPSTERILEIFSTATSFTTTASSRRPSTPNSRPNRCRSSTSWSSRPASTRNSRNHRNIPREMCGTSARSTGEQ